MTLAHDSVSEGNLPRLSAADLENHGLAIGDVMMYGAVSNADKLPDIQASVKELLEPYRQAGQLTVHLATDTRASPHLRRIK